MHDTATARWICSPRLVIAAAMLSLLLSPPLARAADTPITEAAVRALIATLDRAAATQDLAPWAEHLAADCTITMHGAVPGNTLVQRLDRAEYLQLVATVWQRLKDNNIRYAYTAGPLSVRLEDQGRVAIATGSSTETITAPDGGSLTTRGRSTMRIESHDGKLMIVSILATADVAPAVPSAVRTRVQN